MAKPLAFAVVFLGLVALVVSDETTTIPVECKNAEIQLSILLDCTGSMGSYIGAVKNQITQVATSLPNAEVNFVCYRDYGDGDKHFQHFPSATAFSADMSEVSKFVGTMRASGGGDAPEDNFGALKKAINELPWQGIGKRKFVWMIAQNGEGGRSGDKNQQCTKLAEMQGFGIGLIFTSLPRRSDKNKEMMNHWSNCYRNGADEMVVMDFKSDGQLPQFMEIFIQEVCSEVRKDIDGPKCIDFGWRHPLSRIAVDPMPAMDIWDSSMVRRDADSKGWQHSMCLMAASGGMSADETGARDITGKAGNGDEIKKYSRCDGKWGWPDVDGKFALWTDLCKFSCFVKDPENPIPVADQCAYPTPSPTPIPTAEPTSEPTASPTSEPTSEPTALPTSEPTASPTSEPTGSPTPAPTSEPTAEPTRSPTKPEDPTPSPTSPTQQPTPEPTSRPTATPTAVPTSEPTSEPTAYPTASPTTSPTSEPTTSPTTKPTPEPTLAPTSRTPPGKHTFELPFMSINDFEEGWPTLDEALKGLGIDDKKFADMLFEIPSKVLIKDNNDDIHDFDFVAARTKVVWPADVLVWVDEDDIKINGTKISNDTDTITSPATRLSVAPVLATFATLVVAAFSLTKQ